MRPMKRDLCVKWDLRMTPTCAIHEKRPMCHKRHTYETYIWNLHMRPMKRDLCVTRNLYIKPTRWWRFKSRFETGCETYMGDTWKESYVSSETNIWNLHMRPMKRDLCVKWDLRMKPTYATHKKRPICQMRPVYETYMAMTIQTSPWDRDVKLTCAIHEKRPMCQMRPTYRPMCQMRPIYETTYATHEKRPMCQMRPTYDTYMCDTWKETHVSNETYI